MKLLAILKLMRCHQPIGFFLLLWPSLGALWWAYQNIPPLLEIGRVSLACFFLRSAGCCLNDIADRNFDGHVQRTHARVLAQKKLTITQAYISSGSLLLTAAILGFPYWMVLWPWMMLAVIMIIIYPYCKRFLYCPQVFLAILWNLSILMIGVMVQHQISYEIGILYVAGFFWTMAYDTIYAMSDEADDRRLNLYSSPIFLGKSTVYWIIGFYALSLLFSIIPFFLQGTPSLIVLTFISLAALAVCYQMFLVIRVKKYGVAYQAFLSSHWIGYFFFLAVIFHFI